MLKPRIAYCSYFKQWYCTGNKIIRFGSSPNQAYIRWRLRVDELKYYDKFK